MVDAGPLCLEHDGRYNYNTPNNTSPQVRQELEAGQGRLTASTSCPTTASLRFGLLPQGQPRWPSQGFFSIRHPLDLPVVVSLELGQLWMR